MTTITCAAVSALLFIAAVLAAIAWFFETPAERARRRHRAGWSQRRIAARQGVSRHRVKAWLMA